MNAMFRFITTILAEKSQSGGGGEEPTVGTSVDSIDVVNASTGAIITTSIADGDSIDLDIAPLTFRANTSGLVKSVKYELDGVEINRNNVAPYYALPYRVYKTPGQYAINIDIRPLDFGVGIRTLKVTPYSLENGQGAAGTPFELEIKFIRTSSITETPSTTFAANSTEFESAITGGDHYDIIEFDSVMDCSGFSPDITKKIKLVGTGPSAELQNVSNWDIFSGITLRGFKITSGNICFRIQNGADGIFVGDLEVSNINKLIQLNVENDANGMAINNIVGDNIIGSRPAITDCFGQISNMSVRNCDVRNFIASNGAVQAFRIGTDTGTIENHDIIFEHNYVDNMVPDLDDTGEVHGAHLFGNHMYVYNNTIKNVITDSDHSDHEGFDCKGDWHYIAYNWIHNGGARGQEGHLNKKDKQVGGILEHNLITSGGVSIVNGTPIVRTMDTGQGMTVHGDNIIRFNTFVLQHPSDSSGGAVLMHMFNNDNSFIHDNFVLINGAKMCRFTQTDKPSGTSQVHVYNNTIRIKTLETAGVFYKNSEPAHVTIHQEGGDDLCPTSGKNGTGCAIEFGLHPTNSDWTAGYVPQGNFLIDVS